MAGLDIGGLLGNLTQAGGSYLSMDRAIADTNSVGDQALNLAGTFSDELSAQSKFKPFALTSNLASANTTLDAQGNPTLNMSLNPQMQAGQQAIFSTMGNMLGDIDQDQGVREGDIFSKLEALMQPSRDRDALNLEQRLFNQGRTGVSTSAYGGTPEQLAMQKAIEEQRGTSAVNAMTLANQERDANVANMASLGSTAMLPQEQLNRLMDYGIQVSDLVGLGDRQGASDATAMMQTGLESKIKASSAAADLKQLQMQNMLGAFGGTPVNPDGSGGSTGLIENIYNMIPGIT